MTLDFNAKFSDAQALTGTAAIQSTYNYDLGVAVRANDLDILVNISAVSGTTPGVKIDVIGSDDGVQTNPVVLASISPVIAAGQAAKNHYICVPPQARKRFLSLQFTPSGTTPALTVTAGVTSGKQVDYQVP